MATQEAFTLDGLALNDGTTLAVDSVSWPPPRQRQDWVGAADSEAQLLVRNPLHENRKVTLRVAVIPQSTMDLALAKIASVLDKLQKASRYTDGIGLVWTPATSTLSCTFDVLAGEITDLPIADENGWFAMAPQFTIELTCKPYWRGTETLTSSTSASTPFVSLEIANVTGDVPALGRLIVTDAATQSRRHVEWGLEGPLTYNSGTSLLVDSDNLVTTGFSGSQSTQAGAYDPNAAGNSVVAVALQFGQTMAVCGTGNLSHVGVFRVKARVQTTNAANEWRLSWRAGDGPSNSNAWVSTNNANAWEEVDLGTITIPPVLSGTQRWTGQIDVLADSVTNPGTGIVDYLVLVPASDGYGKARASFSYRAGALVGYDGFDSTTAGVALNARVASIGGTWATSGSATDFAFADDLSGEQVKRSTSSDASARFAILGSTSYTDTQVEALTYRAGGSVSGNIEQGVIARWTDSSNYVRATGLRDSANARSFSITQRVAGTDTVLATTTLPTGWEVGSWWCVRIVVFPSGRVLAWILDSSKTSIVAVLEASSTALATAGTLATGKPGIYDFSTNTTSVPRYYDAVSLSTPAAEPIALYSGRTMQIRYDDVFRDDSTGTYIGRPQSYRGARFTVPVGTSRVLVKARRNDIETAADDQVTDSTTIQVGWTPRGLAVPR